MKRQTIPFKSVTHPKQRHTKKYSKIVIAARYSIFVLDFDSQEK